jgi:hypothetical protein
MKIIPAFRQAIHLMILPSFEWRVIRDTPATVKMLLYNYILPIIIFSALGKTIGSVFSIQSYWGLSRIWFIILFPLYNFISWIAISYLVIFFSAIILDRLAPGFGAEHNLINSYKLVVYAYTPLLIVTFFIYLHPILRILVPIGMYVFGAYTLYILWYGVHELYEIPLERRIGFILLVILIELVFFFFLGKGLELMTGSLFPGMTIYLR